MNGLMSIDEKARALARWEGEGGRTLPAPQELACPKHPEIRRSQLGACPKCGMTLEPTLAPRNS